MPYKSTDGTRWIAGTPTDLTGWEYTDEPPNLEEPIQPNWQGFLDLIRDETIAILDELAQDSPSLQSYLFSAFDQTNPEKILKFWNKAVEKSPKFRNALEVEYEPGLTRADWFRQEAPKYNIPATLNADLTLSPI